MQIRIMILTFALGRNIMKSKNPKGGLFMDLRSFREDKLKIKTQSAFAELIGVEQSSISRWEKDPDSIPFQIIQRIIE